MRASSSAVALATALALAGCTLTGTLGASADTSPPSTAEQGASGNASDHGDPAGIRGALVRAQLEPLLGMTIADARAQLVQLGHDGEVSIVEQPTFSDRCGVQRVCAVEPEAGTGIHDRITLVVNPSSDVDIALPP